MTMWKATHYGVDVTAQYTSYIGRFKELLRERGIKYTEAPILTHDVIEYDTNGKHKYACIEKHGAFDEGAWEYVCITERIPLDLDWEALMRDCEEQDGISRKEPQKMKTKAIKVIEEAEYYSYIDKGEPFIFDLEVDYNMMKRYILYDLKISMEELMEMDLSGIDDDILENIKNADPFAVMSKKYLNYKPYNPFNPKKKIEKEVL